MIAHIKGTVEHKDLSHVVIDVHGIGYRVYLTGSHLADVVLGENATLVTYLAVRENSHELYGFRDHEELRVFELLISISGIGPKSALSILNATTIESLKQAVYSEDVTLLTRVSGIGRKIAEKILIELRGKLDVDETSAYLKDEADVIDALRSLGYTSKESLDALKNVPKDVSGASERVKHALKHLSR